MIEPQLQAKLDAVAEDVKGILPTLTGSVTIHLSGQKPKVDINASNVTGVKKKGRRE